MNKNDWEDATPIHDAVIVGAGMSGLCAAIKLREAGYKDIVILEKSEGVGGTWHDNIYPGSGCDVPSHLYSYSFALNPDWTHVFSRQDEILRYFEKCADDFGVRPYLRTKVEVASAEFKDDAWHVVSKDGRSWRARFLIMGVGQLNRPQIPGLTGLGRFQGQIFHSARWNYNVDLKGKHVAVVGTGASAVQFVPEIVKQAAHVDVYQRSPNWVIPRKDKAYGRLTKWLFRNIPGLMRTYRAWIYAKLEARFAGFHKGAWVGKLIEAQARSHLEREIKNPDLRAKLTPDFPVGCKRILISDDYYAALAKDNVTLHTTPIEYVESQAIHTSDGVRHPADVIIFGTGFETTGFLHPIKVTGRGGLDLHQTWAKGAEAYMGVTVAGFPNMFLLYGPNTNLGHNSIIFMVERQVDYMLGLLSQMKARQAPWIDVQAHVMERYNTATQDQLKSSVWDAGCGSWYKTESGKITNNWPSWTIAYWWKMRRPNINEFEVAKLPQTAINRDNA